MFGSGDLGMGVTFNLKDNATGPAQTAGNSVTTLGQTIDKVSSSIQNAAGRITSGIVATTAAVLMLIGPFAAAVSASSEFNFQISRAAAIGQATAQEVVQLKNAAFELGSTTMYDATEIAKTEVVLAQAGFAVKQQLELLPGLTDLATAGFVSMDYAANIASDTLFQFGLATKDMSRVADVIVNAANMSNMSVENFGNAMKYFGPTAKAFELSLEEASAYVEMMANSGMRGSVGTRAFGTALMNLASPTKQAAELMAQIGFEAYDSAGRFVGLEQMVRRVSASMQGMSNKQRDNALSIIFGNESTQEMLQLLNLEFRAIENGQEVIYKGADALHYFTQKNLEAKGVAALVSKGIRDNLKVDIQMLGAAFETLKIKMGDVLEGPLRGFVQGLRWWISTIQDLMDTKFGKWLVIITAGIAGLASAMIVMGFVIAVLTPAVWSMITAVGALMIELLPFILVFGAIVGIIYLAKKGFDEFIDVMNGGEAKSGFLGFLQKVGGVLMSVYEIWTSWNGETFTMSQKLHDALEKIGILDFVLNLATWIVRIKEFFYGFMEVAVMTYVVIEEVVGYIIDSFVDLSNTIAESLGLDKLTGKLELFKAMGMAAASVVLVLVSPFLLLGAAIGLLVNLVELLIANFKELGKLVDWQDWLSGVAIGATTGDWSALPGANFKNTFANKGSILPGGTSDGSTTFDKLGQRQAEIMASLGMRSDSQAVIAAPEGSGVKEQFVNNIYLDSEKIAEQVMNKEALKNARQ